MNVCEFSFGHNEYCKIVCVYVCFGHRRKLESECKKKKNQTIKKKNLHPAFTWPYKNTENQWCKPCLPDPHTISILGQHYLWLHIYYLCDTINLSFATFLSNQMWDWAIEHAPCISPVKPPCLWPTYKSTNKHTYTNIQYKSSKKNTWSMYIFLDLYDWKLSGSVSYTIECIKQFILKKSQPIKINDST